MTAFGHFYRDRGAEFWGIYGPRDNDSLGRHWAAPRYMGLNQQPIAVVVENDRTGLIWKIFMSGAEASTAIRKLAEATRAEIARASDAQAQRR